MPRKILSLLAIAAIIGAAGLALRLNAVMSAPLGPGAPEFFEIRPGESAAEIARNLGRSGVIDSPRAFRLAYRLFYAPGTFKAGEYRLAGADRPQSVRDLVQVLIRGRIFFHTLTVPEGLTLWETADLLRGRDFLETGALPAVLADASPIRDLDAEAADLEGYLFPETYRVSRRTTVAELVAEMAAEFRAAFGEPWRRRAAELGWSVREAVTLASLVEEETAIPAERPLVSAVFHNRLRRGMKLDCDPTVLYALRRGGRAPERLLTRHLGFPSPYNTYVSAGLPPGPICSPGRAALEAALFPADTDALYFVARGDGGHTFSRTLQEHNAAVRKYRLQNR